MISLCTLLPCAALYLWLDPFKVVRDYDLYMEDPEEDALRIGMNKGIVTLASYSDNLKERADTSEGKGRCNIDPYNAFIFGSSISCYYDAEEWRDLLEARNRGLAPAHPEGDQGYRCIHPFHFDSASESPMSMARKVEYLHASGAPLDYALVILDPLIMATDDQATPFAIDPPELHCGDAIYPLRFHYTFFRAAMNFDFLKSYIAGDLTGKPLNVGHNPIFEEQPIVYDKALNQERLPQWDSLIRTSPEIFYAEHPLLPPSHSVTPSKPILALPAATSAKGLAACGNESDLGGSCNSEEESFASDGKATERSDAFRRIAEIFMEHATDYEVIISPNRRGVGLAPADLAVLQQIFGPKRVHDFSYSEAWRLREDTMLYDNTHYRPPFASRLMRSVYLP